MASYFTTKVAILLLRKAQDIKEKTMKKFRIVQEISFEVEANSKFEALEKVGENITKLIDSKEFCIDGACYAAEIPAKGFQVYNYEEIEEIR